MDTASFRSFGLRIARALDRFLWQPASPRPLAVLRIGVCVVLMWQAFAISGSIDDLYGSRGLVQRRTSLGYNALPDIDTVVNLLAPLGISETNSIRGVFLLYLTALTSLVVGYRTRISAFVAWLMQLLLQSSGWASLYGVDKFANIALFYCMWMPVGHAFAADVLGGRVSDSSSAMARLGLRTLQLHLCLVYFSGGILKATGAQWRNGEAIWRVLMKPGSQQFYVSWLAGVPWLAAAAAWSTLAIEMGYPFLVWPRKTRALTALAAIGMHVGIALSMGLVTFSAMMIVLNTSAFLISPEPVATSRP